MMKTRKRTRKVKGKTMAFK
jgi:hypothetical protein